MHTLFSRVAIAFWISLKSSGKYWFFLLPGAASLSYLVGALLLTNSYGMYIPYRLTLSLVTLPLFYLMLAFLSGFIILPRVAELSKQDWIRLGLSSMAAALALFFIFPNSLPVISQNHHLQVIASGTKNEHALGSLVEIRQIRYLNNRPAPLDQVQYAGDWQIDQNILLSVNGNPATIADLQGPMAGGLVLSLRYLDTGGIVSFIWDGVKTEIDLYSSQATIEDVVFEGFTWSQLPLLEAGLVGFTFVLYFLSLFSIFLLLSLVLRLHLVPAKIGTLLVGLAYMGCFLAFLDVKMSYREFSGVRAYRDSISYVQAANVPITSLDFWAGARTFPLPLVYKLMGVRVADRLMGGMMEPVRTFQTWFSVVCWTLLALGVSSKIRQRWIKPLAFGCVLYFSLNLEIGIWDGLMLSESLSISLFALLVTAWIGWEAVLAQKRQPWIRWVYLAGLLLISVLYSFARDSNLYFLLIAAFVFVLRLLLNREDRSHRQQFAIYSASILLIFAFQYFSISYGNRWQFYIYDHLAYRILPDQQATRFFVEHGLPMSAKLMNITKVPAEIYQDSLLYDDELTPVKQWVDQSGRMTYLLYLLSKFPAVLVEPVQQVDLLLDGSVVKEYHYPIYLARWYSPQVRQITDFFYFQSGFFEWVAGLLLLIGSVLWILRVKGFSAWFVVTIMAVSIYPLMFIIWHGEPMEIERHAIQIGIQFRLAAWMALLFFIDWLAIQVFVEPAQKAALIGAEYAIS